MLSKERSGPSPITHVGKSSIGILQPMLNQIIINESATKFKFVTHVFLDDT